MNITVLDAATFGDDLDLSPLDTFGAVTVYRTTLPEQVAERLANADVAVINKVKITEEVAKAAKHLKLICIMATGYDNVDLDACRACGIGVCNVAGYSTHSVSQLTVTMALSLYTHLPEYAEHTKSGAYTHGGVQNCLVPVYHEMRGKTWGIIGDGNIGAQVARVAEALGARILIYRKHETGDAREVSLDTLLCESDILSLHVPLNDETRGMIGKAQIERMKDGVMLLNVARGAVLDERAIADAVLSGKIGFFGCDVYSTEPYGENHPYTEIATLPQVCLTPHMAWGAKEARTLCLDECCENIRSYLAGGTRSRVDLL